MHTLSISVLGLCALSVARTLRKARLQLLATVHKLGCAGVIAGELVSWPFALRLAIWIVFMGSAVFGGSAMRKRELREQSGEQRR